MFSPLPMTVFKLSLELECRFRLRFFGSLKSLLSPSMVMCVCISARACFTCLSLMLPSRSLETAQATTFLLLVVNLIWLMLLYLPLLSYLSDVLSSKRLSTDSFILGPVLQRICSFSFLKVFPEMSLLW